MEVEYRLFPLYYLCLIPITIPSAAMVMLAGPAAGGFREPAFNDKHPIVRDRERRTPRVIMQHTCEKRRIDLISNEFRFSDSRIEGQESVMLTIRLDR